MKTSYSKTAAKSIRALGRLVKADEDAILPDEAESLAAARRDRERGDVLSHEEVWA